MLTLTKAVDDGLGSIVVTGTEFTKTTTKFFVDGADTAFEWLSDTSVKIAGDGSELEVYAVKGDVTTDAVHIDEADASEETPTPPDGEEESGGTPPDPGPAVDTDPISPSQPPVPAVTVEELGIGPRDPYPTGNPPPAVDKGALNEDAKRAAGLLDEPAGAPTDVI